MEGRMAGSGDGLVVSGSSGTGLVRSRGCSLGGTWLCRFMSLNHSRLLTLAASALPRCRPELLVVSSCSRDRTTVWA